jgi:flagellar protein FlgJ
VLLPPAEPVPPAAVSAAPAAVSANPAPQATVTPATVTVTPGNDGGNGPVPYGLPWVHHNGDGETGLPKPHHAAATGGGDTSRADAESFVEELGPSIEKASARLGVSPRILLAQAALETGWGHSVVGNNVFGVKAGASWSGTTVTAATHEMTGGHLVAHSGTFRSYANVGQAVDDYAALVSASGRYRSAMGSGDNAAAYAQALAAGGYASDRDYAAKLVAVANSPKMSYAIASLEDASPGQLVSAHG